MKNVMDVKVKTSNCEITESLSQNICSQLVAEITHFPDHAQIDLLISKIHNRHWSFNISMRYSRGHVAFTTNAVSLEKVLQNGLSEFKSDLRIHELQWSVETFHFDKTAEYDYFIEVSKVVPLVLQKKMKVLMIEDDPAASMVLKATLEAYGCRADHFDRPDQALQALENHKYDLLILDWNLPYMKGGEFLFAANSLLQKMQSQTQAQVRLPVVICTSMPIEEIRIPDVEHFFIVNYWHKSLPFSSILGSIDETTKQLARQRLETASDSLL